jgi:acyl-homoserine lactone acylase PvdQ
MPSQPTELIGNSAGVPGIRTKTEGDLFYLLGVQLVTLRGRMAS